MKNYSIGNIKTEDVDLVILDIDGTLKDLCAEHSNALESVIDLMRQNGSKANLRVGLVRIINALAMLLIKLGLFSTNKKKQGFLLSIFAIILGVNIKYFKSQYDFYYSGEVINFNGACKVCRDISSKKEILFVTINEQNLNLEKYGIEQSKIRYAKTNSKYQVYKETIEKSGIQRSKILIVGDNIIDDVFPAKRLGVKYILVNNYYSKIKNLFCKIINKERRD